MAYLFDACGLALLSLSGQWVRTLLSVVGIAIGIAAFTITVSINVGGRNMVLAELQTFGLRSVWMKREYSNFDIQGKPFIFSSGLDYSDIEDVRQGCCAAVGAVTATIAARDTQPIQFRNRFSQSQIIGVDREYLKINQDALVSGRYFNEEDVRGARPVILIGSRTREDLFEGRTTVLGEVVQFGSVPYQVIGVLAEKKRDLLKSIGISKGEDPNRRVLVPYSAVQRSSQRANEIDSIQLEMAPGATAEQVKDQITRLLKRNHGARFQYSTEDMQKYISTADGILKSITLIGLAASAMSLLVGIIGITNVMAISVLERTREIGVRKAMGATRRAILIQFGVEAVTIGWIGGLLGVILSYGGLAIARQFSALAVNPSALVLLYAVLVAGLAGGIAGIYPSYKAATMNPTDALRS